MLNENRLKKYDRIDTRSAIVRTIQILNKFIDFLKIYRSLYFSEQMLLRD